MLCEMKVLQAVVVVCVSVGTIGKYVLHGFFVGRFNDISFHHNTGNGREEVSDNVPLVAGLSTLR